MTDFGTPYEGAINYEHWCSICDLHVVNQKEKDSGKFFTKFGHVYNPVTGKYDGEYCGILFSVCARCLISN
jgi:hypothetical protein